VQIPVEWLVGPAAGLVIALVVAAALWRDHQAQDQRERERTDEADARVDRLTKLLRDALSKAAPK
jgi:hypothetical protein